jgi:serine/threonine protein kinase/Tol biopolymer transport system component
MAHGALIDVAGAIADGLPIDWSAFASTAPELALAARIVERVAQVHASFPPPTAFTSSLQASLLHLGESPETDGGTLLTWGPLTILERIGGGTCGEVYRARDPRLNRPVALKLLRRRDRHGSSVVEEGHLMARVRHPNVVTVYGAERIDGRVGLWMEYVDGPTLDQELKAGGPFPHERVTQVGLDLCRALDAVHRAGLVHRDVKAQNVMRDANGRVLIADFGAGRDLAELDGATRGELAGTPLYLAPEVLNGERASPASDIYSVGVLLFYLATGSFPVHGRSVRDIREAHARGRRQAIEEIRRGLPRQLRSCISRALDPDPGRRFPSATAMEAALQNATKTPKSMLGARTAAWLAVSGIVVAAVAAGAGFPWTSEPRDRSADPGSLAPPVSVSAASLAPTLRQISNDPDLAGPGAPSPDGRLLSYVDPQTCNLAIADAATGKRWPVTANPSPEDPAWGCADTSRFSADGSALLYVWSFKSEGRRITEIRRLAIHGGVPRSLWRSPDDANVQLQHWAGDDRFMLVTLERDNGNELAIIDGENGTARAVKSLGRWLPELASLSPDGTLIAYDRPAPTDPSRRVVIAAAVDGAAVETLAESTSNDHDPLWTRDGRYVIFQSNRSGVAALWAQRVDGGRAIDPPVRLEPNLGQAFPMGLTATGAYFVRREMGTRDVFLVNLDPVTGAVNDEPARVSATAGSNGTSEWSPDGRSLAFFRTGGTRRTLVIKTLADGREREIPNRHLEGVARPRWAPGGRTMLLKGTYRDVTGLHRLDLQSAAITTLMPFGVDGRFQEYELLPDGREVLYASRQRHRFVRRDLGTGREIVVHEVDPSLNMLGLALTRDGRRFAYAAYERGGASSLRVVDLSDGATAREVLRGSANEYIVPSVWTPDGREVVFTRTQVKPPPAEPTRLFAIDADTQRVRLIGLRVKGLNEVRLSPDGGRITYDGGWPFQEVWVLENVLARLER